MRWQNLGDGEDSAGCSLMVALHRALHHLRIFLKKRLGFTACAYMGCWQCGTFRRIRRLEEHHQWRQKKVDVLAGQWEKAIFPISLFGSCHFKIWIFINKAWPKSEQSHGVWQGPPALDAGSPSPTGHHLGLSVFTASFLDLAHTTQVTTALSGHCHMPSNLTFTAVDVKKRALVKPDPFFVIPYWRGTVFGVQESNFESLEMLRNFGIGLAVLRFRMYSFHGIAPDLHWRLRKRSYRRLLHVRLVITTRWWLKYSTVFPEKMLPYFFHTRLKQILTQKYSQQPLTGHNFCWSCVWRWRFRP